MKNNIRFRSRNEGITFASLLLLLFIGLKLGNVIDWSWIWVLSPIWIPYAMIIIGAFILTCVTKMKKEE